jgi:hypothetical protein
LIGHNVFQQPTDTSVRIAQPPAATKTAPLQKMINDAGEKLMFA